MAINKIVRMLKSIYYLFFFGVLCILLVSCETQYGAEENDMSWGLVSVSDTKVIEARVNKRTAYASSGPEGGIVVFDPWPVLKMNSAHGSDIDTIVYPNNHFECDWCEVSLEDDKYVVTFPEDRSGIKRELRIYLSDDFAWYRGDIILQRHP